MPQECFVLPDHSSEIINVVFNLAHQTAGILHWLIEMRMWRNVFLFPVEVEENVICADMQQDNKKFLMVEKYSRP